MIREGRIVEVESMTEVERLSFAHPFEEMEAFQTSGGTSTLPESFLGRVRELDYKTIRYPGHCDRFKTMIDLGLCGSRTIEVNALELRPRDVLAALLVRNLPHDGPDVVLVRVECRGDGRTLRYDIVDRFDPATGLSAMMRTTAFPAAIVTLMMARNQTLRKGALPQEQCIPPDAFMKELATRNIVVHEQWTASH